MEIFLFIKSLILLIKLLVMNLVIIIFCSIYRLKTNKKSTRMSSKGKRALRQITVLDKVEAIRRIHNGESKASVARDIGVPESTLRGWCKNEEKLKFLSQQQMIDGKMAPRLDDNAYMNGPTPKRPKLDDSIFGQGINPLNVLGYPQDFLNYRQLDMNVFNDCLKNKDPNGAMNLNKVGLNSSMSATSPYSGAFGKSGGLTNVGMANFNLFAHLQNPNLAMMAGLTNLAAGGSRTAKQPKTHSPAQNYRAESEKSSPLMVKDLYKLQKSSESEKRSNEQSAIEKMKSMPGSSRDTMPGVDETLWNWIKNQQSLLAAANPLVGNHLNPSTSNGSTNLLGLNGLYNLLPNVASPHRSSPPQGQFPTLNDLAATPTSTSRAQYSTPPAAANVDDSKASWLWQLYKTYGNTLLSDKQNSANLKPLYENLLLSTIKKENDTKDEAQGSNAPQDLSMNTTVNCKQEDMKDELEPMTPVNDIKLEMNATDSNVSSSPVLSLDKTGKDSPSPSTSSELDSLHHHNNNDINVRDENTSTPHQNGDSIGINEAIMHGEKLMKWLESCSNPNITTVQVMNFKNMIKNLKLSTTNTSRNSNSDSEEEPRKNRRK